MSKDGSSGNGLILFMGERVEHALTAIQKYTPETVYIITSEKFASKHKRRIKEWSKHYNFRPGGVKSIDNLFHKSAITSILNEVISIRREEDEMQESDLSWFMGITGGTMHMAAAGSYAGLVLGIRLFYVTMPQGESKPMPNRDVIEFPQLLGLGMVMHLPIEVISYLKKGTGEVNELSEYMSEKIFWHLCEMDLLFLDEGNWFLTEEGNVILNLVGETSIAQSAKDQKLKDFEKIVEKAKKENPESFIGWA
jgi:hypothetical protein